MITAWNDLPNAAHINCILAAANADPFRWAAARDAMTSAARETAMVSAWDNVKNVARETKWSDAMIATWDTAGNAACFAILALIAYDDCAHMLDGNPEDVKLIALLGSDAAILLYPACVALNTKMEII